MESKNKKTVEETPATEPLTKTIQLEIEQRAKDKYSKEYNVAFEFLLSNPILSRIVVILKNDESVELINSWGGNALFKENQNNNGYADETISNYNEIKDKRIKELIKEETELFLSDVKQSKNKPTSKQQDAPKIPIASPQPIKDRIAEKEKEKTYLFNFLSTLYKGNDAKAKVEAHLQVINNEIDNLKWFLSLVEENKD